MSLRHPVLCKAFFLPNINVFKSNNYCSISPRANAATSPIDQRGSGHVRDLRGGALGAHPLPPRRGI